MLKTEPIKYRGRSLTAGPTHTAVWALVIFLCMNIVAAGTAAAQRKGVGIIGAGINGAIILNELSKNSGKRKFKSSRSKSTKVTSGRSTKSAKSRSRKQQDNETEIVEKRKSSEPKAHTEQVATGSTGPRSEDKG